MELCELAAIISACAFGSAVLLYIASRRNVYDAAAMMDDAAATYEQARQLAEEASARFFDSQSEV